MEYLGKKKWILLLLLMPTLTFYLAYVIFPIFVSFWYSLTNSTGLGEYRFVGLQNYRNLLEDPLFAVSFKNSFLIVFIVLVLMLPASFFLAIMLKRRFKGSDIVMTLVFMPVVIAPIFVGLIWSFILDPVTGLFNMLLQKIGLESLSLQWIGGTHLTPYSVAVVQTWEYVGLLMLILLAGLRSISDEIYQAGSIDGTTPMQRLLFLTIPMVKESLVMGVILIISGGFKIYETVLVLTAGGPNGVSNVLATYMYRETFLSYQYGYGASISVVIFFLTMLFSVLSIFLANKKD